MRIVHVLPTRDPAYGGPIGVVDAWKTRLLTKGDQVVVLPERDSADGSWALGFWPGWKSLQDMSRTIRSADLVHLHGLWTIPTSAAAEMAVRAGRPYVVSLHGMADPWTLRRSRWKKRLYRALIEERTLSRASAVHLLSTRELDSARAFGITAPCFILPNGADCKALARLPSRAALGVRCPEVVGRTVVLFLGRLHPKKGLDLLVPAFHAAVARAPDLHLVIAGPDEGGHGLSVRKDVEKRALAGRVTFLGKVVGEEKRVALAGADMFVLTSYQEGDALAVKEAMAAGLPVLMSEPCEFPAVRGREAAVICGQAVDAITDALVMLGTDVEARRRMADRGRDLVTDLYDWDELVVRLREHYFDILRGTRIALDWATP